MKTRWFLALVLVLLVGGCEQRAFVSSSMAPTIKPGEKVIVDYTAYAVAAPKRWDVVAFEPPMFANQTWVMRVVALPGETVSFVSGGITVNGQSLALPPYVTNVIYVSLDHFALIEDRSTITSPYIVPSDGYFVLGDNSTNSNDSRWWGALPLTNIIGRVRNK